MSVPTDVEDDRHQVEGVEDRTESTLHLPVWDYGRLCYCSKESITGESESFVLTCLLSFIETSCYFELKLFIFLILIPSHKREVGHSRGVTHQMERSKGFH